MNYVSLKGNLTRDPETKYLPSGAALADFSVAVNEVWYNDAKQKQERTHFFDCVAFGKLAENIGKFFTKGMPILVSGSLAQESWEDRTTGQKRSKIKVKVQDFDFCGGDSKPREGDLPKQSAPLPQRPTPDPLPAEQVPY